MKQTLEEKISTASTLLDVLLILKEVTMLDTHVSTLAYMESLIEVYDEDSGYGILNCRPFPLERGQNEYLIQAYYFHTAGNNLKPGDKIQIVFTDKNFINSLKAVTKEPKLANEENTHSLKYAIVILQNFTELEEMSDEEKEELMDLE